MNYKEEYRKYLNSEDWKNKRKLKLSKTKNCSICNNKNNLDVHHIFYKNWYDVENSDLRILCRTCHYACHNLMDNKIIVFKENGSHHSRFAIIKHQVKKYLGYNNDNMFKS